MYIVMVFFGISASVLVVLSILVRPIRFRGAVMALLMAGIGFMQLFLYLIGTQKIYDYPHFFFTQIPVVLILGPLVYLFVQSILQNKKSMERGDWLHYVPAVMSLIILMPFLINSADKKRELIYGVLQMGTFVPLRLAVVVILGSLSLYIVISIRDVWRQRASGNPATQKLMILLALLFASMLISVLGSIGVMTLWFPLIRGNSVCMTFLIMGIYLLSQRFPYLVSHATVPVRNRKEHDWKLSREEIMNMDTQIKNLMQVEKFYCDEDLTLAKLSDALEVTPHFLSHFLNEHYKKNFNTYINSYRVKEAKKLLLEEPQRNTLSIAYAAGFNSYTAFYTAFKKKTRLSPAEYRARNLK